MKDTPYRKAWLAWVKTPEFENTIEAMQRQGISKPYSENILQVAFSSGWNRHIEFKYGLEPMSAIDATNSKSYMKTKASKQTD
jgi:hypothetical protein